MRRAFSISSRRFRIPGRSSRIPFETALVSMTHPPGTTSLNSYHADPKGSSKTEPRRTPETPPMSHPHPPLEGHDRGRPETRRPPSLPSLGLHEGVAFEHSYPRHWHEEIFVTAITGGAGVFRWGRT